jgi:septum site-determining protein MinC
VFNLSVAIQTRISFRLLGRSYLAFVIAPERPLVDWLVELDRRVESSLSFFANRPLVLDLTNVAPTKAEAFEIIAFIEERNLRLIAVEGADPDWLPPRLAPLPGAVQSVGMFAPKDEERPSRPEPPQAEAWEPEASIGPPSAALLISEPVRSGQTIIYPHGDVIVVGSVASGAEIIAGGSIHVYGSLRGRAFAGTNGNTNARIFCSKFDAEILVIDGLYKTADDFDLALRGSPVQARLDRNVMNIEQMS